MNSWEQAKWFRDHAVELAEFNLPSTEISVTALGLTQAVTDDGFSEVNPFDRLECAFDGTADDTPWACLPDDTEKVESFDFLFT